MTTTAQRRSRYRLAAVLSLLVGVALAVYLVVGNHPWDSERAMPVGAGRGVHPSDLLAVVPLLGGVGLAAWFAWRGHLVGARSKTTQVSPGVPAPRRR